MRVSPARTFLLLIFLALAVLSTACGSLGAFGFDDLPSGAYAPHPDFERFYIQNGGYDVFGYAISTSYTNQLGERFQYFETVLMKYHPATKQISFMPIGLELGVANLPTLPWEGGQPGDGLLVGEYTVHPAFVDLFLSLGPDLTGLPVTQPFVNPGRNRVEQHFENLGMFYQLDDPEQAAMLLDYGLVHCTSCQPQKSPGAAIIQTPLVEPFFYDQMKRLSISPSTSGEVLKGPVQLIDGTTELVFEHMLLAAVNDEMIIRPLPVLLGLKDEFLYAPNDHPAMVFYEISEGIGHNVISPFDAYIRQHGGYAVSGQPITEAVLLNPELRQVRQCFENYCLDFLPDLPGENVRPVRLGALYLESGIPQYDESKTDPEIEAPTQIKRRTNPFTLIVWEHPTVVDSQTPETISVMVALENTPQPGMEVFLIVEYPDGSEVQIQMPPTAENGVTSITLDPVVADNGDLVFYDACLVVQGATQLCVEQSFMIWGNP